MTPHERIEQYWAGERPDRIPFSIYGAFCGDFSQNPQWVRLFERGLVPTYWAGTVSKSTKDVEKVTDTYEDNGHAMRRATIKTPVGDIYTTTQDGWIQKHWLATAEDYRVRTWIVKNSEIHPAFDRYHQMREQTAPWGLILPSIGRTPLQSIIVDGAGLEQFCYHLVDYEEAVMELYEALFLNFKKTVEITTDAPGKYVACVENFTAETMGPVRYKKLLMPAYEQCFPMLHQAGKIVGTHYDGRLASVKDLITESPIDLIESLTEPPEGDMTLAECRSTWPEKKFWVNINVSNFDLSTDQLRDLISQKVEEAASDGRNLAFEISEDLPENWQRGIPAVFDVLGY